MSRPERSKQSYQNQVAFLKKKLAKSEKSREVLVTLLEGSDAAYIRYRYAPITKRIKYVFTREI